MGVGSTIELYTTILSWQVYNVIWDGLVSTGIIFAPILFIILSYLKSITSALLAEIAEASEESGSEASKVMAELIFRLILTLFVILFFMWPTSDIEINTITYSPVPTFAEKNPKQINASLASDPTTLNGAFKTILSDASSIKVPIGWALIMSGSSGFTFGVAYSFDRIPDLDASTAVLSTSVIENADTVKEVTDFYSDCFITARNKYDSWLGRSDRVNAALTTRINKYGKSDLTYIGSNVFLETAGLYAPCTNVKSCGNSIRSEEERRSFPYNNVRDKDVIKSSTSTGRPYCNEWWKVIEKTILETESRAVKTTWDSIRTFFGGDITDAKVKQARVERVLLNTSLSGQEAGKLIGTSMFSSEHSKRLGVLEATALSTTYGRAGQIALWALEGSFNAVGAYTNSKKQGYIKSGSGLITAILLFIIVIIIPFALVWTLFDLGTVFSLAIAYFVIRFSSALFEIGNLLSSVLKKAFLVNADAYIGYLNGDNSLRSSYELLVALTYLLPSLFLFIPLGFLYFSQNFGFSSGGNIANTTSQNTGSIKTKTGINSAVSVAARKGMK